MERIANEWRASVVDFTKRNSLLFFKPSTKTLEISGDGLVQVEGLLAGEAVGLSQLVKDSEADLINAEKVAQKLLRDQKLYLEELGVSPVFLAIGFCSWVESEASGNTQEEKTTNAPVFLVQVEIDHQRSAKEPFKLKPGEPIKLNGVLAHAADAAGIEFDDEDFLSNLSEAPDLEDLYSLIDDLEYELDELEEFATNYDVQLGVFRYLDESIYRDLADVDALMESDLVRAMAGDSEAISSVQNQDLIPLDSPDTADPSAEHLILEADASQSQVISSAMAGKVVVVEGPPGTGKSQTISNLLAEAIATKRSVLFVAQKRAAITAVTSRLEKKGLDRLVLDIHEQSKGPEVAKQLLSSFENMNQAQAIDKDDVDEALIESREKLLDFRRAVFVEEVALGRTLSSWRDEYFSCPEKARPSWRLSDDFVNGLDLDGYKSLMQLVTELAETGGLSPEFTTRKSSWKVELVKTDEELQVLLAAAREFLSTSFPKVTDVVSANSKTQPTSLLAVLEKARASITKGFLAENAPKLLGKGLSKEGVQKYLLGLGAIEGGKPNLGDRISSRIAMASLVPGSVPNKIQALRALETLMASKKASIPASPVCPANVSWSENLGHLQSVESLISSLQGLKVSEETPKSLHQMVTSLLRDTSQSKIPTYWGLRAKVESLGQPEFLENLQQSYSAEGGASQLVRVVGASISQSIIERTLASDQRLMGLSSADLAEATKKFNIAESDHYRLNARKIKRLAAEHLRESCNEFPDEYKYLLGEAKKKRAHKPLRTLIAKAPNLMVAANPIWAMSPVQVANFLTRKSKFDLVIFDEASQVKPEMAIPSIIRGKGIVIAGDSNQLPPTNFFSGAGLSTADNSEDQYFEDTTKDSESILEAAERVIGSSGKRLNWHYRSRDERLIALSNLEIYGNSLTTFPASDTPDALRHVLVKSEKHRDTVSGISNNEVEKTIGLIVEHQKKNPTESLGVITFGVNHLSKLEMALEIARRQNAGLDRWLDSNEKEPFFMKNLERVQGDERDAIILFTGYGRSTDGKINMQWGPLTQEVGRRRLNVAISRAKRRMTLVSTMSSAEFETANIKVGTGIDLYQKFLDYMENNGVSYKRQGEQVPLNPFELDIKQKLESAGLTITTQYGVGNYRLDFVVHDPSDPAKFLLAIEADGASYHSGHTARERDRLRQMALEERGWRFHRIWSTDWFRDPVGEIDKVKAAVALISQYSSLADEIGEDETDWDVDEPAGRLGEPPVRYRSNTIDNYSDSHLYSVVRYIKSDGRVYTDEEIIEEAARYWLGLSKLTQRARRRLGAVIARLRNE